MKMQVTMNIEVDDEQFEDFQTMKEAVIDNLILDLNTEEGSLAIKAVSVDWDTLMETSIYEKKLKPFSPWGPEFR